MLKSKPKEINKNTEWQWIHQAHDEYISNDDKNERQNKNKGKQRAISFIYQVNLLHPIGYVKHQQV